MHETVVYEVGPDRPGVVVETCSGEGQYGDIESWSVESWYPPEIPGPVGPDGTTKPISSVGAAEDEADSWARMGYRARVRIID